MAQARRRHGGAVEPLRALRGACRRRRGAAAGGGARPRALPLRQDPRRARQGLGGALSRDGGGARLASAIDAALLERLKACFPKGGKARLVSVQPVLMAAYNRARERIPREGAWLVLAEADRACLARLARAGWALGAERGARRDWRALLERERSRASGEPLPSLVLVSAHERAPLAARLRRAAPRAAALAGLARAGGWRSALAGACWSRAPRRAARAAAPRGGREPARRARARRAPCRASGSTSELKSAQATVRQLALPWAQLIDALERAATREVAVLQLQPDAQQRAAAPHRRGAQPGADVRLPAPPGRRRRLRRGAPA